MTRLFTRYLWQKALRYSTGNLVSGANLTSAINSVGRRQLWWANNRVTTRSQLLFHTYSRLSTLSNTPTKEAALDNETTLDPKLSSALKNSRWSTVQQLIQQVAAKPALSNEEVFAIESALWALGQPIRDNDMIDANKRAQTTVAICNALQEGGHALTQKQHYQLIRALGRLNRSGEARGVFRAMQKAHNGTLDTRAYNVLLAAHRESGDLREALDIFAEMRRQPLQLANNQSAVSYQPNLASYNTLIALAVKSGEITLAEELREDMSRVGIRPDITTFTPLLQWYTSKNQMEASHRLMLSMKRANVTASLYLWNILLSMYTRLNEFNQAKWAYKDMLQASIQPDVYTYVALIKAATNAGDIDSAERFFFTDMPKHQVKPNVFTYGAIMDAYASAGQWEQIETLVERLQAHGIKSNSVIYAIRIRARAALQDIEGAQKLFDIMQTEKILPDAVVYAALIEAYAKRNDLDNAMRLFEAMRTATSTANANQPAFKRSKEMSSTRMAAHLALIDAFIHNDDVPAAMSIYEDLRESRMPLTTWHYNALLKAFMSNPDINDQHGARIYEDMRRAHVPFNAYTYTILFNAFGRRGDLNSVQQIHQYLVIDSNIDPDIAVWNSLMDAYQRTDQPVQVVQIWQQLVYDFENNEQARQSSTPVVDCATISIVLDTCGWHYYPWLARRIWQQLPEFGIRPNTNNYVSYIECMTRVGEYDEAMQTFMQVSTIDPTVKWPNYKVVATLAGLLRQKNQSELLDQLTEWVKLHHSSLSAALDPAFIDESNQTTSSSSSSL